MPVKKQKNAILITIPWTATRKTIIKRPTLRQASLVILGLFILLTTSLGSGALPYTLGVVRCFGLPVQTSDFMASKTIKLPGEDGYGPNFLSNYTYCTKAQAQAAGYGPSVLSEESKQKFEAQRLAQEEAKRFAPSKVPYTVYVPTHPDYEASNLELSTIQSNLHTFMRIKKNGTVIGQIRELKSTDSYNICKEQDDPNKSYCTVIGHDAQGREIKRNFYNGFKGWQSQYVGVTINDTGVILSSDDDAEAIKILSSLQEYTENN